ncbi:MAG: VWA domain-containing protein [Myxococcales bacterium]|nr:VWA domain-containing protein [Myxococcales bacterium]MCB9579119.1 VWA domain-containing protein [Polyangiaceae bacterium]
MGFVVLFAGLGILYPALARGPELMNAAWHRPWFLLGLLLVPFVFWRGTFGEDRRTPRLLLGTVAPLTRGPQGPRVWLRDAPGVLRAIGLTLAVLAMARPVNTLSPQTADEKGIDIVLVLDLSGSMQAVMDNLPPDLKKYTSRRDSRIRPTRLDAAKAVIRDFISRRKTDRIGVVVFGKEAYVLSPPTLDYHLLDALVSRMELKLIDGSATAIGDAVGVSVARLRNSHAASKAVILLTDGDNNSGAISPEYAAHLANVVGAKLFTIQIGDGDEAEVQDGFDLFGQPRYVTVPFPVNPELLKDLAQKTGGETYVATDAKALEASFHDVLDKLEKTRFEANVASFEDLYRFFLLPAVLLLALDALLRALVLRRFP